MEDRWNLTFKVKTNIPKYDCDSENVCISTFWRLRCQRLVNDVSRDHFDETEWIIYQDDRVVSYLVCLMYTSKWFHVAYNCNVRSFNVLFPKDSEFKTIWVQNLGRDGFAVSDYSKLRAKTFLVYRGCLL